MSSPCENHFQPAYPESLTRPDSPIRSLVVIVQKLKSQILPSKICEELSAKLNLENEQILSLQISQKSRQCGQFIKDFSTKQVVLFHFLLLHITTEAMGFGGLRANSLSYRYKSKSGSKAS